MRSCCRRALCGPGWSSWCMRHARLVAVTASPTHHLTAWIVASPHAQSRRWSSSVVLSTVPHSTVSCYVLTFHEREGAAITPLTCGRGWAAERTFYPAYCWVSDLLRLLPFAFLHPVPPL